MFDSDDLVEPIEAQVNGGELEYVHTNGQSDNLMD